MNQPVKSEKTPINLTSATVAPPPSEKPEYDTTTPVNDQVEALTLRDMNTWGPWLLCRLQEHFPQFTALNYTGFLSQHMSQNHYKIVRTKFAVMMAAYTRDTLDIRPVIDLVFLFKHHPDREEENKDVRRLLRELDVWARSHGATHIRILHPDRCDANFSKMTDMLYGQQVKYISKEIKA